MLIREHHETKHGRKEAEGVDKEAGGGRDAGTCNNGHHFSQKSMDNAKGFGIGKDKEDKGGIKAVFDL